MANLFKHRRLNKGGRMINERNRDRVDFSRYQHLLIVPGAFKSLDFKKCLDGGRL